MLFKAPQFQAYFRNFVIEYEERSSRPFKFERGPALFADQRNELFAQLERETTAAKRQKNDVEEKENSGANKLQHSPL